MRSAQSERANRTDADKDGAKQIPLIAKDLVGGIDRRSAHLINLSLATLKWLMLYGESDDVRFRAAQALLDSPPLRQKLDFMRDIVVPPGRGRGPVRSAQLGRRLKAVVDAGPEHAQRMLALLEQAENEAGVKENSGLKDDNSNGIKRTP